MKAKQTYAPLNLSKHAHYFCECQKPMHICLVSVHIAMHHFHFFYQGNHGEDVKECYYYLRSSPTHSYMKALYKYPMQEFPYQQLVQQNAARTVRDCEYELLDTGTAFTATSVY